MRTTLITLFLTVLAGGAWAQGHAAHDMGSMSPATLAAHCAQMKQDTAHPDTPDMRKMMAQCDELDRNAAAASRRR